jgi:hypothetical protein
MVSNISFEYNIPVFAGAPEEGTDPVHRDMPCYGRLDWEMTKHGIQRAEELGSFLCKSAECVDGDAIDEAVDRCPDEVQGAQKPEGASGLLQA